MRFRLKATTSVHGIYFPSVRTRRSMLGLTFEPAFPQTLSMRPAEVMRG